MDIILIRHGQRVLNSSDDDPALAPEGRTQVDHLKDQLAHLMIKPTIYLTSRSKRTMQTTERLLDIYPVDVLTPKNNTLISEHILETITDEAKQEGIELGQQAVIAIVGHEPQLSQILASLTSKEASTEIGTGKGVLVRAASLSDFLQGKGKIQERIN